MQTFYFYDLETSSGSPRDGRIMQFAGQRTDYDLIPIGEPDNILLRLSDDIIPEPDAILVHGITPQSSIAEGITEKAFVDYFQDKISTPDTIFVGYNNIRFDDEFMRRICYRNFYDPYQWHWKDGRSRWDLLDAMRIMRALRPDGISWPFVDGKPTVRLELMAKENGLLHTHAHDALSDVTALIQLAQKFKSSQPKLFKYLLELRGKDAVAKLALDSKPFIYTSGKFNNEYHKTTVVVTIAKHPRRDAAVVYDLREDPTPWFGKTVEELKTHWTVRYGDDTPRLPVKTMQFNKCPTVAPLSVMDSSAQERIAIDMEAVARHRKILFENSDFRANVMKALDLIEDQQQTALSLDTPADEQIYDGFWGQADQKELSEIRATAPQQLSGLQAKIKNKKIREMLPLYKARNFPELLDAEERSKWEEYRTKVLLGGGKSSHASKVYSRLQELAATNLNSEQEYLLTELQIYIESILPEQES